MKLICATCGQELESANRPHTKQDHEIQKLELLLEVYRETSLRFLAKDLTTIKETGINTGNYDRA